MLQILINVDLHLFIYPFSAFVPMLSTTAKTIQIVEYQYISHTN